jgi:hypothetical protein
VHAATTLDGFSAASPFAIGSVGDVLMDFEHPAASIGESVLLLTLLDGRPTGIHRRAVCGSCRGTCVGGSANHRGGRDRMIVTVPTATAFDVDVLVDVDAVGTAASDIGATGIGPAAATTTGASATTTAAAGRSRRATTTTATTASTTSTAATSAAGGLSRGGDDEAGQHERGQRGQKQLAE